MSVVDLIGPRGGTLAAQGPFSVAPGAGVTLDATNVRPGSGDKSVRIDITSATALLIKQLPASNSRISYMIALRPDMIRTTAHVSAVVRLRDTADTKFVELRLSGIATANGSNILQLHSEDAVGAPLTLVHPTTPANGSWYVIEVSIDASVNPWVLNWRMKPHGGTWVDGPVGLPAFTAAPAFLFYSQGTLSNAFGWRYNTQDFVINTGSSAYVTPGENRDLYVVDRVPTAVGIHSLDATPSLKFFTDTGSAETAITSAETTSWQNIDDVADLSAGTDRVEMKGPDASRYLEYAIAAPGSDEVAYAKLTAALDQDVASATHNPILRAVENLDSLDVLTGVVNSATRVYKHAMVTPPGGGAWSNARLAAMRWRWGLAAAGAVGDVTRLHSLLLSVAIPTATPGTTSALGTKLNTALISGTARGARLNTDVVGGTAMGTKLNTEVL